MALIIPQQLEDKIMANPLHNVQSAERFITNLGGLNPSTANDLVQLTPAFGAAGRKFCITHLKVNLEAGATHTSNTDLVLVNQADNTVNMTLQTATSAAAQEWKDLQDEDDTGSPVGQPLIYRSLQQVYLALKYRTAKAAAIASGVHGRVFIQYMAVYS